MAHNHIKAVFRGYLCNWVHFWFIAVRSSASGGHVFQAQTDDQPRSSSSVTVQLATRRRCFDADGGAHCVIHYQGWPASRPGQLVVANCRPCRFPPCRRAFSLVGILDREHAKDQFAWYQRDRPGHTRDGWDAGHTVVCLSQCVGDCVRDDAGSAFSARVDLGVQAPAQLAWRTHVRRFYVWTMGGIGVLSNTRPRCDSCVCRAGE